MNRFGIKVSNLLEQPFKVSLICLVMLLIGVVFDGSLWRLYQLRQNKNLLESKIDDENKRIKLIKNQLHQFKNPAFIEKQARERLEFLEKDDLLFVFSEE